MNQDRLANGLGWFGIGLGLAEIVLPGKLCDALGIPRRKAIVRSLGLREVASGAAILSQENKEPGVWARVGGDAMDLGGLGVALKQSQKKVVVGAVLAAVAAVAALDVICGVKLRQSAV